MGLDPTVTIGDVFQFLTMAALILGLIYAAKQFRASADALKAAQAQAKATGAQAEATQRQVAQERSLRTLEYATQQLAREELRKFRVWLDEQVTRACSQPGHRLPPRQAHEFAGDAFRFGNACNRIGAGHKHGWLDAAVVDTLWTTEWFRARWDILAPWYEDSQRERGLHEPPYPHFRHLAGHET